MSVPGRSEPQVFSPNFIYFPLPSLWRSSCARSTGHTCADQIRLDPSGTQESFRQGSERENLHPRGFPQKFRHFMGWFFGGYEEFSKFANSQNIFRCRHNSAKFSQVSVKFSQIQPSFSLVFVFLVVLDGVGGAPWPSLTKTRIWDQNPPKSKIYRNRDHLDAPKPTKNHNSAKFSQVSVKFQSNSAKFYIF